MVKKYGLLKAIERAVDRDTDTSGFTTLCEMGMKVKSYEEFVLRNPEAFGVEAVFPRRRCRGLFSHHHCKVATTT